MLVHANFVPSMTAQVLRRCECGGPNPIAVGRDTCGRCGRPPVDGRKFTVDAEITGRNLASLVARAFIWAGRKAASIAEGL